MPNLVITKEALKTNGHLFIFIMTLVKIKNNPVTFMCLFGIYSIFHQSLTTSEFLLQTMNMSSKFHHESLPTCFLIFP